MLKPIVRWFKHAFAVDSSPAVPSASQIKIIDYVCGEIIRRKMTLPAQLTLESSAPLHFVAGQMLRFVEPFLSVLLEPSEIKEFATFLEKRGAMEYLSRRIDELQQTNIIK